MPRSQQVQELQELQKLQEIHELQNYKNFRKYNNYINYTSYIACQSNGLQGKIRDGSHESITEKTDSVYMNYHYLNCR